MRKRSRNYSRLMQERRRRRANAMNETAEPAEAKRSLLYRGILLCPHQVLLAYAVTPASQAPALSQKGVVTDINVGRYLNILGDEAISYTIRVFEKISYLLQTTPEQHRSFVMVVPLSYDSLLRGHDRTDFLNCMKRHPEWVRRNMLLSVFGCPANPGSSIVQRFSGEFVSLFRTVDWQVTDPDFSVGIFQGCNFNTITLDTYGIRPQIRGRALKKFISRVPDIRRLSIKAGVSGVNTREELTACMGAKVSYVSGDAITGPLPTFALAQKIELIDLPVSEPTMLDISFSADKAA